MARQVIDCRWAPNLENCTVAIAADSTDELLEAAVQHAKSVHGYEDSEELRNTLRESFKDAAASELA